MSAIIALRTLLAVISKQETSTFIHIQYYLHCLTADDIKPCVIIWLIIVNPYPLTFRVFKILHVIIWSGIF